MQEIWLQAGPVDELAETSANLIIGDPVVNQALDREVAQAAA